MAFQTVLPELIIWSNPTSLSINLFQA